MQPVARVTAVVSTSPRRCRHGRHHRGHQGEGRKTAVVARHRLVKLLEWWRYNHRIFLVLCYFARDVLVVPMPTVSSKAIFSMVERIIFLKKKIIPYARDK